MVSSYLRMAVAILQVSHEGEPLPAHAITALPQAPDVVLAEGAVGSNGVILNLLGRLEGSHATLPFAQERQRRVRLRDASHA